MAKIIKNVDNLNHSEEDVVVDSNVETSNNLPANNCVLCEHCESICAFCGQSFKVQSE